LYTSIQTGQWLLFQPMYLPSDYNEIYVYYPKKKKKKNSRFLDGFKAFRN